LTFVHVFVIIVDMKKLRMAVIGLGRLGSLHAKIYSGFQNVELVSLCDVDSVKAKSIASSLKKIWCTDYKELKK